MRTLGTILKWVILLPILGVILALAVANGQLVAVHFNPFNAADPALKIDLPLYQIGFIVFVLGALTGGLVAWASRMKQRRRERARRESEALFKSRPAEQGGFDTRPNAGLLPRPGRRAA